jgi:uncharacterized phage-associated protein
MAYNVLDIAHKILVRASNCEEGELISNMKLQKLLYYMQGFHIAVFEEKLFEEDIEAWQYGPVVPVVYEKYNPNGSNGIQPEDKEVIALEKTEERLFEQVFKIYNQYTAYGLMNLTHNETPWKNTNTGKGSVISYDKLKSYFKTRLN